MFQIHEENQRNMRRYQDGIQKANIHLEDEQRAKDIGNSIKCSFISS